MAGVKDLVIAVREAERFIEKAELAIEDVKQYHFEKEKGIEYPHLGNINSAAAKRASMDLTRVLVKVRK